MLTPDQQIAFDILYTRIQTKEQYTTLQGYAGTGKTYLVAELYKKLCDDHSQVYVCAPTHKAAQVLNEKIGQSATTIHSFLGLKLVPDHRGGYKLIRNDKKIVPNRCIVLLDEASMIGKTLWKFIEAESSIKWIFIGDPAQLPPVNEEPSHVFQFDGYELTKIVRQAEGNPIINLAWHVRLNEPYIKTIDTIKDRAEFLDQALDNFKQEGRDSRILAYRNLTVNEYNCYIRLRLYGKNSDRFLKGEWLVAKETWCSNKYIVLTNSEEVEILDIQSDTVDQWNIYNITITGDRRINVLHEDDQNEYQEALDRLLITARQDRTQWWKFYSLKEKFAQVDYLYAMTVHKAQGSTFKSVYIDHEDLSVCSVHERRKLIYVAVTRSSERLVMYV